MITPGVVFDLIHSNEEEAKTNPIPPRLIKFTASKELARVMKICRALMTQSSKLLPSSGVRLSSCLVGIKQQRTSWFHNEAIGLDWQRPIDVMEEDAQQVLDLITRMDRGVYK